MSFGDNVSYGEKAGVMIAFRNEVQTLWLVFSVFLILPYILKIRDRKVVHPERSWEANRSVVVFFVLATGIFSLAWIYVGLISGSASRDPQLYAIWVNKFLKPDLLFTAFGRLRDCFYFLVPLALTKAKQKWVKLVLVMLVAINLYAALQLGGRGIVLLPILEIYFGVFLLGLSRIYLLAATCLMFTIGISGSQLLRGNHNLRFYDPTWMMKASGTVLTRTSTVQTGLSLYGCSDSYNFTIDNVNKPGAGWIRSERWLTSWVPSILKGTAKGSSRDAHIIAEQLENGTSRQAAEAKHYVSFNCVTFPGDLFWRWRWLGVWLGCFIFGQLYYIFSVVWSKLIRLDRLSGCLAFCFPVSFLSLYPAGSIGETAWLWTWDIQKYFFLFIAIRFLESKNLIPWIRR